MKRLEPAKVSLHGTQLIEASAGTGKTWTIALLVLRLVVERGLEVGRILVVTYTVAATGELRSRIRARLLEAAALYRGALLVALPSIYEGFGLPAVEAMAAGAPLVCSDIPVLREVAGDAAVYVPPEQPEAWADRIGELLADSELRRELARRGRARSRRFDWRQTAEQTLTVWRAAV